MDEPYQKYRIDTLYNKRLTLLLHKTGSVLQENDVEYEIRFVGLVAKESGFQSLIDTRFCTLTELKINPPNRQPMLVKSKADGGWISAM